MRLTAQPHCKICIFFNVAPKILENAENAQKKRATRNRLVYRDDAEGDWASRCRHRENTSRRQAKKLQPLRKPHSASVWWGRKWSPPARSVRVQSLTLSCQRIIKTTTQSGSAASHKKKVKQKRARSRAHVNRRPLAPKSAVYHLGYLGIDECMRKKLRFM